MIVGISCACTTCDGTRLIVATGDGLEVTSSSSSGQLLLAGGHLDSWIGLPNAYTYNSLDNTWTRLPDMNNGRWYPTNTTLPNEDMLVISGWINASVGVNVEPQVWQSATGSWRNLTTAHVALPFYPFMLVAPNGKVFCAGPSQTTRDLNGHRAI